MGLEWWPQPPLPFQTSPPPFYFLDLRLPDLHRAPQDHTSWSYGLACRLHSSCCLYQRLAIMKSSTSLKAHVLPSGKDWSLSTEVKNHRWGLKLWSTVWWETGILHSLKISPHKILITLKGQKTVTLHWGTWWVLPSLSDPSCIPMTSRKMSWALDVMHQEEAITPKFFPAKMA